MYSADCTPNNIIKEEKEILETHPFRDEDKYYNFQEEEEDRDSDQIQINQDSIRLNSQNHYFKSSKEEGKL